MFTASPIQKEIDIRGKQARAWHYLNDNHTKEVLYGGAAGGGKSFLGCLWHITRRVRFPGTRGLIGRSDLAALEQSTLITYFKVCQILGYQMGVDYRYNSQKHIINWSNGSQSILKDLFQYPSDPDFIALGSTEYTDAFIDELTEVSQKAFDIVNSRIRWMLTDYDLVPKIMGTCNPGPGWVKDTYLTDPLTQRAVILQPYQKFVRALVTDNPDKDFVKIYSDQLSKMHSEYDRQRLLYGNWDVQDGVRNPFAFQYDPAVHESEQAVYSPNKTLYISVDFNMNPFAVTFWHQFQDAKGYHFHGVDECEIANGNVDAMIELIKARYGHHLHNCILTGDAMGDRGEISRRDNASHYVTMKRGLNIPEERIQVPANPRHSNSRNDVNKLLFEAKQPEAVRKIFFYLNPRTMPNTCRDFRNVQCYANGEIMKGNRKDLNQRGDYLDAGRYFINLTWTPVKNRLKM